MRVVEEFTAVFPETDQNRGIRRLIPSRYQGQPLSPEVLSVTDGDGRQRPMEVEEDDDVVSITSRADEYLHGRQVFVITYELENVTRVFEDTGTELYWNVNGIEWAQSFGVVDARVHLDADAADALAAEACYAGPAGVNAPCEDISVAEVAGGGAVVTVVARDLGPGETLTFALGFEEGAFAVRDVSYFGSGIGWVQAVAALAAAGVLGWAVRLRRTVWRDEPGRPVVVTEFTPPEGMDALQAAVFLGKQSKAIPAEVLEQAVAGSIRIMEGAPSRWGKKAPLVAELVDRSRADANGRVLLDALFPSGQPGETYEFGKQDTKVSKTAQKILSDTSKALTARGLRRKGSGKLRVWPILAMTVIVIVVVGAGVWALEYGVPAAVPVLLLIAAALAWVAVLMLCAHTPLTRAGADVRDHLEGLRRFIAWAEEDRIRMLQSPEGAERVAVDVDDPRQMLRLYESLLPYAVVFGQEKQWAEHLAVLYERTDAAGPSWYVGAGAFHAASFSAGIGTLSASAAATSSTSSGGSTGGGSAGGGGGGGGGGGV